MSLGETIKAARVKAGFTQRKLGELLGYEGRSGEVTVQRWERDERPVPQKHLKPLSKLLNIPLEQLLP